MNQFVRLVDGDAIEIPAFTVDVVGHAVDLRSTSEWYLHSATSKRVKLRWSHVDGCDEDAVSSLRFHMVRLIETKGTALVENTFRIISMFLRKMRDSEDAPSKSLTLASLMWYLGLLRIARRGYQFHNIRQWYVASADRFLDGFDDEVVYALEDLRIEGNAKGFAVLSADPEHGPLSELEERALRAALIRDRGPIEQRAAVWLAFAFGTNPANLALLREEDFIAKHFPGDVPSAFFLQMPRIKKRQLPRSDFKTRFVDNPLAEIIEELIANNKLVAGNDSVRPLFRTNVARGRLIGGPLEEYANHNSAEAITSLIAKCVDRLGVNSPRTGKPLRVTTRRLRYTFASKMVRMKTPERELAELLDHTDTQQVQVYYKADSRFVERLDATIAENLGPTVRAFMGELIERDEKSVDLIPFRDLPALGQCGASFACGLSAPKNCYTCSKFAAFADGAHSTVLDSLVQERTELLEGGYERIAQQLDTTILAVGEVVARARGTAE